MSTATSVRDRELGGDVGATVLLSAAAIWLALGAVWVIDATYRRFRGRTDLDMPEWFAINVEVTLKVLPLVGLAVVCQLAAAVLFTQWAGRAGWGMRVGFAAQWLAAAVVGGVALSRVP